MQYSIVTSGIFTQLTYNINQNYPCQTKKYQFSNFFHLILQFILHIVYHHCTKSSVNDLYFYTAICLMFMQIKNHQVSLAVYYYLYYFLKIQNPCFPRICRTLLAETSIISQLLISTPICPFICSLNTARSSAHAASMKYFISSVS